MAFSLLDAAWGAIGGLLIGLSAMLYLLANGRIAGISGIAGQALAVTPAPVGARIESAAFLVGLVGAPVALALLTRAPEIGVTTHVPILIAAGLLVGFGTRLGSGCTSGHGVCGMSRFSIRSIVATLSFMAVAGITVFLSRHFLGGAA
ncbi:MAG: YeeE/YedE thiosulfate transporter family protein [Alphaproteobacteria bacterium]|nr:YeeE/YedE thiosulfate transporter family protein [Alphaproteobacteria bacterium]